MIYGYTRVSSETQADHNGDKLQIDAMKAAGCQEPIVYETASGARWERPKLHKLLAKLQPGDTLIVWSLDRLSRSLQDLLKIIDTIAKAGAGFKSLTQPIFDTTTPTGRLMLQIVGAFAEFEHSMLRERTKAGREAAMRRGKHFGPKFKLNAHQQDEIIQAIKSGQKSPADCARTYGIHRSNIHRLLQRSQEKSV
jgi:DNA invertase Pin-like site-specific DNA recombinase